MGKKDFEKGIKSLYKSFVDDIIEQLADLQISNADKVKFTGLLNEKLENSVKRKNNRKSPVIPLEKQCKQLCKSGDKCKVAMCDVELEKCWAHMSGEERESYKATKSV